VTTASQHGSTLGGSHATALPADLVAASAQRLMWTMLILVAADLFYFILFNTVWNEYSNDVGRGSAVCVTVVSVLMIGYLRSCTKTQTQIVAIGVAYEIVICFNLALVELSGFEMYSRPLPGIPWYSVLIVLFAFIIPARPRTMLIASMVAAAMGPLAYLATEQWGTVPDLKTDVIVSFYLPPFVCAIIALAPSRVLNRLSGQIGEARRLGSYELVERLGRGGMGEVWRARHSLLARPAAIKLIKPEVLGAKDSAAVRDLEARFEREAQTTALLESQHTVELYDFGVAEDGVFFYVMELLDGVDLESLVEDFGPIEAERAIHFLVGACDSLDDAHTRGLIHRDIKPANIFAARKGRHHDVTKVLDFGLVKGGVEATGSVTATGEAVIKGTPAYIAPESVTGKKAIDARADIYALGCVAYWLLTGQLVFEAKDALGMAVAHASSEPLPPSERTETPIPPELDALIMKCLEKDPGNRPQTAYELRRALESIELDSEWTSERATKWWSLHKPKPREADAASSAAGPTILRPAAR
jgi:serine/threonine-protein kinase